MAMFLQSLGMVALLWPLVLVAAYAAHNPTLYVWRSHPHGNHLDPLRMGGG